MSKEEKTNRNESSSFLRSSECLFPRRSFFLMTNLINGIEDREFFESIMLKSKVHIDEHLHEGDLILEGGGIELIEVVEAG
jgi:hypothetical protein